MYEQLGTKRLFSLKDPSPYYWKIIIMSGMNSINLLIIAITYFQEAMALNLHSSLCFDEIQQEDDNITLTTTIGIMAPMKGKNLDELHKSWKYHTKDLKEMCQRNEHMDQQISGNNSKFEIGQPVMVKNHVHYTFDPKYLLGYRVLKILNDSTLL